MSVLQDCGENYLGFKIMTDEEIILKIPKPELQDELVIKIRITSYNEAHFTVVIM